MDIHNAHVMVDGQFVSDKASKVVQAIMDYEPELSVKWVPPGNREPGVAAYAIIHKAQGNAPYVLFYVQNDEDFDERVLTRIIMNDQRKNPVGKDMLTAFDEAQKLMQKQEWLDKMEAASDLAYHILKSPLNTYKVDENFIIKDGIPFNAAHMH